LKILGIVSSPKGERSVTLKLVNAAMDAARSVGAETEIADITRMNIKFCTGCMICRKTGTCPLPDEYNGLLDKITESDGIVISSPNYLSHVSAQLKMLLDRSVNIQHEQMLEGKYGFAIMAAGGSDNIPLDYMTTFLKESGAMITGSVSCLLNTPNGMNAALAAASDMGANLARAIAEKRYYPEQQAEHAQWLRDSARTIAVNKEMWSHNYAVWEHRGWLL